MYTVLKENSLGRMPRRLQRCATTNWLLNQIVDAQRRNRLDTPPTGHSFRVGGACALSAMGVSVAQIKILGRWTSDAIEMYLCARGAVRRGFGRHGERKREG